MRGFPYSVGRIRAFRLSLALGATTLALPLFAGTAHACNDDPNRPPAPSASLTVSGTLDPFAELSIGEEGCDGEDGGINEDGHPGFPAQAGGDVTVTVSSGAITGQSTDWEAAVAAVSFGGFGGEGGRTGVKVGTHDLRGGLGGMGGDAGTVRLNFDGTIDGSPDIGLLLISNGAGNITTTGGTGGSGGFAEGGSGESIGGDGGAGGSAGSIIVNSSGSITAIGNALLAVARGGDGGKGGDGDGGAFGFSEGGAGGAGGTGGSVTVGVAGTMIAADAVVADSTGGSGGDGGEAFFQTNSRGGDGGVGGAGGTVHITADGHVTSSSGTALSAFSSGGEGGKGGKAAAFADAKAGSGGDGGAGGSAHVTIMSGAVVRSEATEDAGHAGLLVQSNGGAGGEGGDAGAIVGQAGGGGFGGKAGTASATIDGFIVSTGTFVHGAIVQSVGGMGGDGNNAAGIFAKGGAGLSGGDGGAVSLSGTGGSVLTTGDGAIGMLAQSVGGGGGSGGNALSISVGPLGVAIGGNGGLGGDGGEVTVDLTSGGITATTKKGGAGILAQSIGGAGGAGGNATTDGGGTLSLAIGGDAKGGGKGGDVSVTNGGLLTTFGDHAVGIEAQSIGGGGGKGGAATTFGVGVVPISVAVGGRGGSGGPAGTVGVTNANQIATYGPDAPGVRAQSIGGGGGHGGTAVATALGLSPDPEEFPAISVTVGVGGEGGKGNTADTVSLINSGFVTTAGHGSAALVGQSIGGGGGAGGDSSAAAYTSGTSETSIKISVAVGGSGGEGATGGEVTASNSGLLYTLGQDSFGIFGQSIGGGGGFGGAGDASASSVEGDEGDDLSFSASISVGGSGGTGAAGAKVTLANSGGIATSGDGADGIFGQSVGGGGGTAGGGVGKSNGDDLSMTVQVGGSGGDGGLGGEVDVSNSGGIVTIGTDAMGMTAQSVGGGGGRGGKGGATAGGAPSNTAESLTNTIANGLNIGQPVENLGNGAFQVGDGKLNGITSTEDLEDVTGDEPDGDDDEDGESTNISIDVAIGGKGGKGGDGGDVTATNSGGIKTLGAHSDGIFAHSIGGGGGIGGAASSSTTNDPEDASASLGLGGRGDAGGSGGDVTVANNTGASVTTAGVSAFGIVAQSVGGGGGRGSFAGAKNGALQSFALGIGGDHGVSGDGGTVKVTNNGAVTTTGKHAIGILAQSIGGGGGVAKVISTDQTGNQSNNPTNDQGDDFNIDLKFNGDGSGEGDGGTVTVETAGNPIQTSGRNAHGIVAQSIGGGGGLAVGGRATGNQFIFGGKDGKSGDGGEVFVTVRAGSDITTRGDGAFGIWAQSIGGGGGIGGDIAASADNNNPFVAGNSGGEGKSRDVDVDLEDVSVTVEGANSNAIMAQSIGGGGGWVARSDPAIAYFGSVDGSKGESGAVRVFLRDGTRVVANGQDSNGIFANTGGGFFGITVDVDATSSVTGGRGQGAAIILWSGSDDTNLINRIENAGTISSADKDKSLFAIWSPLDMKSHVTFDNTGTITGKVHLPHDDGNELDNRETGLFESGDEVLLGNSGKLTNSGTISVGGVDNVSTTVLTGNLEQLGPGQHLVDIDASNDQADLHEIIGAAKLSGGIAINPISLRKSTATVLTASEGVDADASFDAESTLLFSFTPIIDETTVKIATDADFLPDATNLDRTRRSLGQHLQAIWDQDASGFGQGFAALAAVADGSSYARTLDSLSGRTIHAISAGRYEASQRFARTGYSCKTFAGDSLLLVENNCGWGRVEGSYFDHEQSSSSPAFEWRAVTAMVGGQKEFKPGWYLGGALGYEMSDLDADGGRVDVDGDAVLGAVTMKHSSGPLLLAGVLDLAYGWNDTSRQSILSGNTQTATASPNSFNAGLHLRAAWQFPFERFYVHPGLELDANHVWLEGYTEGAGGPFNLTVDDSDSLVFAATPTVTIGSRIDLGDGSTLNVHASAGVTFLSGNEWDADARFANAPGSTGGFRSELETDDVVGRFSAGAELLSAGSFSGRAQYNATISSNQTAHSAHLRIGRRF